MLKSVANIAQDPLESIYSVHPIVERSPLNLSTIVFLRVLCVTMSR